jgi:Family of unknown function (DUF6153)
VIRGQHRSRHRDGVLVPGVRLGGLWMRLLFAVVALGVVLMHHVVGAHQHSESASVAPAHVTSAAEPVGGLPATGHAAVEAMTAAPAAMLHVHHDGGDQAATMLTHACLAILAAIASLLVLLVLALWRPQPLLARSGQRLIARVPTRGPPVPRRLAQLQVLRL